MLILSRHEGQAVVIDDGRRKIKVVVTSFNRGKVYLGFEADKSVRIDREEAIGKMTAKRKASAA